MQYITLTKSNSEKIKMIVSFLLWGICMFFIIQMIGSSISLSSYYEEEIIDLTNAGIADIATWKQNHTMISWPYGVPMIFDYLAVIALSIMMLYTCLNLSSVLKKIRANTNIMNYFYGAVIAGTFLLFYNPISEENISVTSFQRVFGQGISRGFDVSRVTSNYSSWMLLFMIIFAAVMGFFTLVRDRSYSEEAKKVWQFLDGVMALSAVNLILRFITYYSKDENNLTEFTYIPYLLELLILISVLYLVLHLDQLISAKQLSCIMIIGCSVAYVIAPLLKVNWANGRTVLGIQLASCIAFLCIILLLQRLLPKNHPVMGNVLSGGALLCSVFPLILSLYLEGTFILAARGHFVVKQRQTFFITVLVAAIVGFVCLILYLLKKRTLIGIERTAYSFLALGISSLFYQLPLQHTRFIHLFESANVSVLTTDFLEFGKIPIVSHYGGHMMTSVWESILYYLLNQDIYGTIYNAYCNIGLPILIMMCFFVLREFMDDSHAFLAVMILPIIPVIERYMPGLPVIVAIGYFLKKRTTISALLLWLSCIWAAFYRLDIGFSFGLASIVCLVVYIVLEKEWRVIKPLAITLASCGGVLGILWVILCIQQGASPISRMKEFLLISLSNQNWGTNGIGDTSKMEFFIFYLLLPFLVLTIVGFIILSKNFQKKVGRIQWGIILLLGVAYLTNFSRGIVRHNLLPGERDFISLFWSAIAFLSLFTVVAIGKKAGMFLMILIILMVQLLKGGDNYIDANIADGSFTRVQSLVNSWKVLDYQLEENPNAITSWADMAEKGEPIQRAYVLDEVTDSLSELEYELNLFLTEEETFLDFRNCSFAYSYLLRRNPVYVSQSPLQLSGEETQIAYIEEIEKDRENIPIAVMPAVYREDGYGIDLAWDMDGLKNSYHYYKAAEYIYQNYRPLCMMGDYALWCLDERYDEYKQILDATLNSEQMLLEESTEGSVLTAIDYGYDQSRIAKDDGEYLETDRPEHNYSLYYLPLYWGEMDEQKAIENPVIRSAQAVNTIVNENDTVSSLFRFEPLGEDEKQEGNYLHIKAAYDTEAGNESDSDQEYTEVVVRLGEMSNGSFIEDYYMKLWIVPGENDYLIRVSADASWYSDAIDTVIVEGTSKVQVSTMQVLEGD